MNKPQKELLDARVTFRITSALRRQLDEVAARDRRSAGKWVTLVLEAAIKSGVSYR